MLSGIPQSEDVFVVLVGSFLADIGVFFERHDIEACHMFGKSDRQKSQKMIVCLVNRKKCKKVLLNNKKLGSIDCPKHNFMQNTKIFANENLTPMNEPNKLRRSGLIHEFDDANDQDNIFLDASQVGNDSVLSSY